MKRYHILLHGIPRLGIDKGDLSQGLSFIYDLTDNNKEELLKEAISETAELNPDYKDIEVISVKEVNDNPENEKDRYILLYDEGKWIKDPE